MEVADVYDTIKGYEMKMSVLKENLYCIMCAWRGLTDREASVYGGCMMCAWCVYDVCMVCV